MKIKPHSLHPGIFTARTHKLFPVGANSLKMKQFYRGRQPPQLHTSLFAIAESDSFQLCDGGENRDHRISEDPAGIQVRLGETASADAAHIAAALGQLFL
jgi:hypothetical protein